jgi:hypothetical protein
MTGKGNWRMKWKAVVLVAAGLTLASSRVDANWTIGQLVNNSGQPVTISVPIGPGTVNGVSSQLATRGNLAVIVLGTGAAVFTDQGHNTPCSRPYWGVKIEYGSQTWGFFYDGGGVVNMTVNADGSVAFAGASNPSQVVVGSGPPRCTQ